jgi:signal transduction histidine kinase
MRERAMGTGARLEVVSTTDRGTRVYLFGPDPR